MRSLWRWRPQLREALRGHLSDHHRFMLGQLMDHLTYLDQQIGHFDERIEALMIPFEQAVSRLMTMPGVGRRTAQNVLAEIGADMSRFPSAGHLASWAASRSRNTYLSSHYRRLAGRRGKKRVIVAVGHTMLEMMYHILRDDVDYQELGHDDLDKLQPQRLTHYLVKRLESLGHEVTLRPVDRAA